MFVAAIGIICIVGLLTELHMEKRRKKALDNQLAEKDRELEAKLAEEKEFLHRDRQKMGTYMENISHQLKTPIAGTLLNLEVLLVTEEDEKRYQKLEDCVKKVQWMSDMTIVLLRLAQIDSGKIWMKRKKEKQDAISEFLYEEGAIPDFSDLESGQERFDDSNDENQLTERQDNKAEDNVEKQSKNQIIEKSKSAGDSRDQQEDEFNRQFIKEIQRSIRRAFIKMGLVVGAAVLAVVLCAVFILPKAVSKFYYDPNEVAGKYEEMITTRMELDLSVYSELFLPGNHRDQVNAVPRGYGEYDIVIPQTTNWTGRSTSVSGRLVRGKLTLYDNNILSRPIMQFYLPGDEDAWAAWEVDENGKETKMDTEARKQESIQYSKEEIAGYNDNDWYLAYVSINDIMDYKDFIEWFQKLSDQKELEWGALWCAVHTEDEDGYLVEPDIGFCPLPSGMSISWDREKYPYLSLLDNSDLIHVAEANDEETMQTHFISMLSYIRDHDEILSMMGQTTDSPNRYQDMIDYVKKNGLKIHGFAVSAKKKALLELYQEAMVSYIQTVPQN